MVEHLKHEGTSHSSSARHLHLFSVQVWGRGGLLEVLMVMWRGVQGGCGMFFPNLQ